MATKGRMWLVLAYALLVRLLVGQHSYSGFSGNMWVESRMKREPHITEDAGTNTTRENIGDMRAQETRARDAVFRRRKQHREENTFVWRYGDYEAQRHWMEMAAHLPMKEWYTYDVDYWGLDYPPVTMYQSQLHAWMMAFFAVDGHHALEKDTSRGYESAPSKRIMRLTAVCSEAVLLWPALVAAALMRAAYGTDPPGEKEAVHGRKLLPRGEAVLATCVMQPVMLLIDHGHFQYNSASLGLSLSAAVVMCCTCHTTKGDTRAWWWWSWSTTEGVRHCIGAILYTLAFMHKHIALYYSLAFFAHLFGSAVRLGTMRDGATRVCLLGAAVIATLGAVLAPWIGLGGDALMQVFARLFPLKRGVFEDYVANFWCATNPIMRWKTRFAENKALAVIGAVMTLAAAMPTVVRQILQPHKHFTGLLLCMFNTSLAFFLFGFQVHEKSILYPLLPASLLTMEYPRTMLPFSAAATLSIVPLMRKDGLGVATLAASVLHVGTLLFVLVHGDPGSPAADVGSRGDPSNREYEHPKVRRSSTRNAMTHTHDDTGERPPPHQSVHSFVTAMVCLFSSRVQVVWRVAVVPTLLSIAAVAAIAPLCDAPAPERLPYIYELVLSVSCFVLFLGSCIAANVIHWHTPSLSTGADTPPPSATFMDDTMSEKEKMM